MVLNRATHHISCCEEFKNEILFSLYEKGPYNFGNISSGKVYYELVTIFIYRSKMDFVKNNRKVIFTYNVFVFIYNDCEVFHLKTLVKPCTVYYQKSCRLLLYL